MKFAGLVLLCLASSAAAVNSFCKADETCSGISECKFGQRQGVCCGNKCAETYPQLYRGATCDPLDPCAGVCVASICNMDEHGHYRCMAGLGFSCNCTAHADCETNLCLGQHCARDAIAVGDRCIMGSQCVSGLCNTGSLGYGVCSRIGLGGDCTPALLGVDYCSEGLFCSSSTRKCTNKLENGASCAFNSQCQTNSTCQSVNGTSHCTSLPTLGELCDGVPCASPYVCNLWTCSQPGQIAVNDFCSNSQACQPGLVCNFILDLTDRGNCVAPNSVGLNGMCVDQSVCERGLVCDDNHMCVPSYLGTSCSPDAAKPCGALKGLVCDCATQKCALDYSADRIATCAAKETAFDLLRPAKTATLNDLTAAQRQAFLEWHCCANCGNPKFRASDEGWVVDCRTLVVTTIDACMVTQPDLLQLQGCPSTNSKILNKTHLGAGLGAAGAVLLMAFGYWMWKKRKAKKRAETFHASIMAAKDDMKNYTYNDVPTDESTF